MTAAVVGFGAAGVAGAAVEADFLDFFVVVELFVAGTVGAMVAAGVAALVSTGVVVVVPVAGAGVSTGTTFASATFAASSA